MGEEGGEGSEGETVRSNACEIAILWQCGVCAMPSITSMCQYYVSVFASTLYSYYARNNVAHTKPPPIATPFACHMKDAPEVARCANFAPCVRSRRRRGGTEPRREGQDTRTSQCIARIIAAAGGVDCRTTACVRRRRRECGCPGGESIRLPVPVPMRASLPLPLPLPVPLPVVVSAMVVLRAKPVARDPAHAYGQGGHGDVQVVTLEAMQDDPASLRGAAVLDLVGSASKLPGDVGAGLPPRRALRAHELGEPEGASPTAMLAGCPQRDARAVPAFDDAHGHAHGRGVEGGRRAAEEAAGALGARDSPGVAGHGEDRAEQDGGEGGEGAGGAGCREGEGQGCGGGRGGGGGRRVGYSGRLRRRQGQGVRSRGGQPRRGGSTWGEDLEVLCTELSQHRVGRPRRCGGGGVVSVVREQRGEGVPRTEDESEVVHGVCSKKSLRE